LNILLEGTGGFGLSANKQSGGKNARHEQYYS
jgi:hypothetical protein